MAIRERKLTVCRYWLAGKCKRGQQCRFAHKLCPESDEMSMEYKRKEQDSSFFAIHADLFVKNIRPFLTSKELTACARAEPSLHHLFRPFTILDLFGKKKTALTCADFQAIEQRVKRGMTKERVRVERTLAKKRKIQATIFRPIDLPLIRPLVHDFFEKRDVLFECFFAKGNGGAEIFADHIVSYLSLKDMLACAKTGQRLHQLCRTWTIPELLRERQVSITKNERVALGKEAMQTVVKYGGIPRQRPTRLVICSQTECFNAKIYHPAELPEINNLIDRYIGSHGRRQDDPRFFGTATRKPALEQRTGEIENPVLVSAVFQRLRPSDRFSNSEYGLDVTGIINKLVQTEGGGNRLVLQPPPRARNAAGRDSDQPSTLLWWYTRIFGDPFPREKKVLVLTISDRHGSIKQLRFEENRLIDMELTVARSSE
uniref:C3H1-type domain-containing protein n=1 Tax=Entomoneis paludosa TaxID=265537 RepID=A0A7S2Y6E9_9STRA|mmetsp:Transcript_1677/g.3576  ORF Transcript_1677/g.3576 Transcript_1677/m.3576 type:complete len:429 (+) Transcript_1677:407-1693(+)|eukprot:CAMPEP_0172472920 /NCGR_PEP_ID=MMETSP1065-20121228/68594_1 /TAXON_ID=265537 /ORGANISM="Amphiprora paludosa, Strain CCMP125" /LENGTH=428 /DNA_ID=CAMNT_0013231089 /DNA_START=363 /DNA_END=1649 /DNA_ORIENTATION=+